jgi:hypothetical protein
VEPFFTACTNDLGHNADQYVAFRAKCRATVRVVFLRWSMHSF